MSPIAAATPAATAVPQQAALPKQLPDSPVEPPNQTKDEPAVPQGNGKSVEELEEQSYQRFNKMKRPASKMEQKPEKKAKGHNTKEKPKKSSAPGSKILGCPRCRGASGGCSLCQDPCYKGVRTPGRQAWKDYMAKRGKEKAKLKTKKK